MITVIRTALFLLCTWQVIAVTFLYCSTIAVYADSFFPIGNIEQSQFEYVVGIGITDLERVPVTYDKSMIKGIPSNVLKTHTFGTVQSNEALEIELGGGVAVPAGTLLSFFWFPYNATGHDIYVHNSWIFSNRLHALGLTPVVYRNLLYYSNGISANQVGESLQVGALGTVPVGIEQRGKAVFDFTVQSPIKIESASVVLNAEDRGKIFNFQFDVANTSSFPEGVVVAGVDQVIAANDTVSVHGTVDYFHELPQEVVLKGREIACFRELINDRLFVISRNDIPANWFWGGIQFDKMGTNSVGNYCIERIDSGISIDWGSSVDTTGTVTATSLEELTVMPPTSAVLKLDVKRVGGVSDTPVITEVFFDASIGPYYRHSSGSNEVEPSRIVFVSDMHPDSSAVIELKFEFPSQLPVEYYSQSHIINYSVNGAEKKSISVSFAKINTQNVSIVPFSDWCESSKFQVKVENVGNVIITENELTIYSGEYLVVEVFDEKGVKILTRYEFIKGTHRLKLPAMSVLRFSSGSGGKVIVGGVQVPVPSCPPVVGVNGGRHAVVSSVEVVNKGTKLSKDEGSLAAIPSEVKGEKTVETKRSSRSSTYNYIWLLLLIAVSAIIGFIRNDQSYRSEVPKNR